MLDVNTEKLSKEEIAKAIQKLKNGKGPGPDGIPTEILKADLKTSTRMLTINTITGDKSYINSWQADKILSFEQEWPFLS